MDSYLSGRLIFLLSGVKLMGFPCYSFLNRRNISLLNQRGFCQLVFAPKVHHSQESVFENLKDENGANFENYMGFKLLYLAILRFPFEIPISPFHSNVVGF